MTSDQITVVQASWAELQASAGAIAPIFYARLFELAPGLGEFLPEDASEQKERFAEALGLAVRGLDKPAKLILGLYDLAREQASRGICDCHYDAAGTALLHALAQGAKLDAEATAAWSEFYALIATVMKKAAGSEAAAA